MNTLLREALHAFHLDGAEAVFIQQHENAIYRVDKQYLLRIHQSAEGLHAGHDASVHQAEMAFLRHLSTHDVPVQQPLAETTLTNGVHATLLTWLEGHHITEAEFTPSLQQQIGHMTARLHQAASGFRHKALRQYDAAHAAQLSSTLQQMGTRHHLNMDEISVVCQAATVIKERLAKAENEFVTIHCDLSQSNLLLTEQGLAPIDFSLCGMGHPMHDLGILLGNTSTQAQRCAMAEGYISAGGKIDLPLLDAGYTLGLLEALDFHADIWPKEPWFAPRLTRWVNEQLKPLADGKPLLDEKMFLLNIK